MLTGGHRLLTVEQINGVIASRVAWRLAAQGMDQETLAKRLGLSPSALMRRMTGVTEFRVSELVLIARELDCSPADFVRIEVQAS